MKVDVLATHQQAQGLDLSGKIVVVIDTLRATSTIITALARGCRQVIPVRTAQEAGILAAGRPQEEFLLAGEDRGECIEGFSLGNSPSQYATMEMKGKTLLLCTTNGTVALEQVSGARQVLVAALLNIEKTAGYIAKKRVPVVLCCAGTRGQFSLEDTLTAGCLLERLRQKEISLELCDLGIAALTLFRAVRQEMETLVAPLFFARLGSAEPEKRDLDFCFNLDRYSILPQYCGGCVAVMDGL